MSMKTVNRLVACSPFPTRDTKVQVRGGVAVIAQKQELTPLKVVFPCDYEDGFNAGVTVFVRGEACKHQYAGQVLVKDGVEFILVPFEQVVAWELTS